MKLQAPFSNAAKKRPLAPVFSPEPLFGAVGSDGASGGADIECVPLDLAPNDGRTIVNYIWLNDVKTKPRAYDPLCAINLDGFARALENANRYPQAQFKIWLDSKLLDASTRYWVGAYFYDVARHGNVEICDLQDIPAYACEAMFAPENCASTYMGRRGTPGCVYVRADCARVLVMNHCVREHVDTARFIYYSDLDCRDLQLNKAAARCGEYGIVINDLGVQTVSHGYIGLDVDNKKLMDAWPRFVGKALADARRGSLGFLAFEWFLEDVYPDHYRSVPDMRIPVLPPVHYELPKTPFFKALGVN